MKRFITTVFVMLAAIVTTSVSADDASQQNWRDFIDAVATGGNSVAQNAAGEFLPGPVSDIAQLLGNAPEVTKAGLQLWISHRMNDAAANDDWGRVDRYQAFLSCVSNNDCTKVRELTGGAGGGSRFSTFEPGQNRFGGDYSHYSMSNADPAECQNSCVGDGRCVAWTYVRPGVQEDNAVCWLKDSVPELSDDSCCTSGKIGVGQEDR